jgi:hypothetical protein
MTVTTFTFSSTKDAAGYLKRQHEAILNGIDDNKRTNAELALKYMEANPDTLAGLQTE